YGGSAPPRSGAFHATIAPYGPFAAGDGSSVFLGVQNDREFARFAEVVLQNASLAADPRFATGPARDANRTARRAEIEGVFGALTGAQVVERLERAEIANARLNTMQEFWDHEQLRARERWRDVDSPGGPVRAMKPPFNLDSFEPRMDGIPALGAHTQAILAELGFAQSEIERLRAQRAV